MLVSGWWRVRVQAVQQVWITASLIFRGRLDGARWWPKGLMNGLKRRNMPIISSLARGSLAKLTLTESRAWPDIWCKSLCVRLPSTCCIVRRVKLELRLSWMPHKFCLTILKLPNSFQYIPIKIYGRHDVIIMNNDLLCVILRFIRTKVTRLVPKSEMIFGRLESSKCWQPREWRRINSQLCTI